MKRFWILVSPGCLLRAVGRVLCGVCWYAKLRRIGDYVEELAIICLT